jgi:DNA-binding CsgD family transcriptional regulator
MRALGWQEELLRFGAPNDETAVEPLTARERDVLELVAEGMSNRAIAERLAISEHTVKLHVGALLGKLGRDPAGAGRNRAASGLDHAVAPGPPQRREPHALRGSSASRNPSPSRLNASTVTKIASPGKTAIHGA